jgi:hypothetical protein
MKSRVEHGHLRHIRTKELTGGTDAFEAGRIVERRQFDALLDIP